MNGFYSLIESHFSEIISVVGALSGVILGFFLNWLSRLGRVKFYIKEVRYYTSKQENDGNFTEIKTITPETKHLSINIDLELLNTSEYSIKIMRDISFLVVSKDSKKKRTYNPMRTRQRQSIETISLKPMEIKHLYLNVGFSEDAQKIVSSDWFIVYRNQKNRKRKVIIRKNN